jgi:hypothetical protein
MLLEGHGDVRSGSRQPTKVDADNMTHWWRRVGVMLPRGGPFGTGGARVGNNAGSPHG